MGLLCVPKCVPGRATATNCSSTDSVGFVVKKKNQKKLEPTSLAGRVIILSGIVTGSEMFHNKDPR